MLLTLEEIGIELLMILATGGAMVCFVWLLTITLIERRELHRLAAARRAEMATLVLRTRSPRTALDKARPAPSVMAHGRDLSR